MKAAQINEYGDATKVVINETEKPKPKANQVLIEVHGSSLNPFDSAVHSGYMKDRIPLALPATLGGDIAGVVTEIGEDVTGFSIGEKVYGQANIVAGNSGAFAEYAATAATQVGLMPNNLSFVEAGSLPLVGVSAVQALYENIKVQGSQKLFIHGGAGGIGSIAIQIAKHLGAYVATTTTGAGIEFVRNLGVDQVVDYKTEDFAKELRGFDAVFDCVGGEDFTKSYGVLKQGGIAVSMIGQPNEAKANEYGISALMQHTAVTTARLDKLRELIENDVVTPHIAKTFPLEQISEAFQAREDGGLNGKIAITIA
jgi:NADPH:quinone reductase-like Zn-dependent oxidoreductase